MKCSKLSYTYFEEMSLLPVNLPSIDQFKAIAKADKPQPEEVLGNDGESAQPEDCDTDIEAFPFNPGAGKSYSVKVK